jgi:cell division protein FtsB
MLEKQILLSKVEFDEMEQELTALRETVKSKTVTTIFRSNWHNPNQYYSGFLSHYVVGTQIEFIMGSDENEVLKNLSEKIDLLEKENGEYKERVYTLDREIWRLKDNSNSWKSLPWYKRLFVK